MQLRRSAQPFAMMAHVPEAIFCWFSETWASGTSGRLVPSGRNRSCPRRRPVRPKPVARCWDLCICAGRPEGTALSRITPTGTIGRSEHTIFALRFAQHLKHKRNLLLLAFFSDDETNCRVWKSPFSEKKKPNNNVDGCYRRSTTISTAVNVRRFILSDINGTALEKF